VPQRPTARSYVPLSKVFVTRDDPTAPPGCRPRQVAGLLQTFLDAFNRGDEARLRRFFHRDESGWKFQWYRLGDVGFYPADAEELFAYFERRHEHHERLRLVKAGMGTRQPGHVGGFLILERSADDLGRGSEEPQLIHGKADLDCETQTINLWSMTGKKVDGEVDVRAPWPCPIPPDWKPAEAAIVCAES